MPHTTDQNTKQSGRRPNAALSRPVQPDDKLAAVVGAEPLPRTEITKRIWDYIKQHKLQDAKNKQRINADDKLKAVFDGREQVSMFEMTKLISGHMR
jgi:chromatin remodeling complex protein RSC6